MGLGCTVTGRLLTQPACPHGHLPREAVPDQPSETSPPLPLSADPNLGRLDSVNFLLNLLVLCSLPHPFPTRSQVLRAQALDVSSSICRWKQGLEGFGPLTQKPVFGSGSLSRVPESSVSLTPGPTCPSCLDQTFSPHDPGVLGSFLHHPLPQPAPPAPALSSRPHPTPLL